MYSLSVVKLLIEPNYKTYYRTYYPSSGLPESQALLGVRRVGNFYCEDMLNELIVKKNSQACLNLIVFVFVDPGISSERLIKVE